METPVLQGDLSRIQLPDVLSFISMLAVALADAMREKFGGDSLTEMRRNYDGYLAQLEKF